LKIQVDELVSADHVDVGKCTETLREQVFWKEATVRWILQNNIKMDLTEIGCEDVI
jgi:hypothetical protein